MSVIDSLLDSGASLSNLSFEDLVSYASTAIEGKESYHKILGRLAMEIGGKYGDKSMQKFADAIEETTGRKISVNTLRNYRWVYSRVGKLNPPDDLPYKAWQFLSSTPEPTKWLTKALSEGWSGQQLIREIRISTGRTDPHRTIVCPNCGREIEIKY